MTVSIGPNGKLIIIRYRVNVVGAYDITKKRCKSAQASAHYLSDDGKLRAVSLLLGDGVITIAILGGRVWVRITGVASEFDVADNLRVQSKCTPRNKRSKEDDSGANGELDARSR